MSHYKPYPEYKDSRVEWLGQVPEHWVTKKLHYWISGYGSGTTPSRDEEYSADGTPWVTTGELRENIVSATEKCVTQEALKNNSALKVHPAGSLVIAMYGATVGRLGVLGVDASLNQACFAIHPSEKIRISFLRNWFEGFRNELLALATGAGQPNISGDKVRNLLLPCPMDLSEQSAIVVHLDRETSRIDALVEKKTRFIELLREKRQALITHAVTKGLDPKVKMKDSGVEWLGEVPEHWAVCKLSFRYSVELGKMLDEKKLTKTSLVPYLRNQDVQWGAINTQDLPEMDIHPAELDRYTVMDGDLMVCEGGDVGRAAIWRGESSVFGYQKALHRLRPRSQDTDVAEFFFFSLLTAKKRGVFEESDSKATIAHLPAEKFRQYRFAFPPKLEQREIADYVRVESERLDVLLTKTERSIELLKERRSALITAAVTGQIDLREAV